MLSEERKTLVKKRVEEILDGATWTHKIHEKQADLYFSIERTLSTISTISLAITGSGVLVTIFNEAAWLKILTAIVSALSLFVSLWNRTFDFEGRAKDQREAAKAFLELREKGRQLAFKIDANFLDGEEIVDVADKLSNDYVYVCKTAPSTTNYAVKKASAALKEKHE